MTGRPQVLTHVLQHSLLQPLIVGLQFPYLLFFLMCTLHSHILKSEPCIQCVLARLADPHHFNADPDPAFHFNADSDPAFHSRPNRDPGPHHCNGKLRLLVFRPSRAPFSAPRPPL